jgi:hypothetical protein
MKRGAISRWKYPERLADFEKLVSELSVCAEASRENVAWAGDQKLPSNDAPILAAAVQAGVELLVTGDATDFGHLYGKTLRGTEVLTPDLAIERVIAT